MTSQTQQLHFLMFPLMARSHMIPLIDTARMLAQRGMLITIVTTQHMASSFKPVLDRAIKSGLQIQVIALNLPCEDSSLTLLNTASLMQQPVEKLVQQLKPKPNCIISDMCLSWTSNIAHMLKIPRISFHGESCFCILCLQNLQISKSFVSSESECFIVPDIPDRIEITKTKLPRFPNQKYKDFNAQMYEVDKESYGVIFNSFEELEPAYVEQYKKEKRGKVWCIGPVSLCNKSELDKAQRGNISVIDENECVLWLDKFGKCSVLYACLGSVCTITTSQWIEFGLGLEASNKPFIWVIKGESNVLEQVKKWIKEDGFGERTKSRGLVILGWAPQVIILSHPSIGGFLTHCGWNSTLEGICYGVPLITWPLFGGHFLTEKLLVQILKIGVPIGVMDPVPWRLDDVGKEQSGPLVNKENVKRAVEELMDGEFEENYKERRERVRLLSEMANRAVEVGGSSYLNIDLFIKEIMHLTRCEWPYMDI